jgi:hypothetical protein
MPIQIRIIDIAKGYNNAHEDPASHLKQIYNVSGNNSFITYVIQVTNQLEGKSTEVRHRYSDFELLRAYLCRQYPFTVIPTIPEKQTLLEALGTLAKAPLTLGRAGTDPEVVSKRKRMFESFLHRIVRKRILCEDLTVKAFLGVDATVKWRDSALTSPTRYNIDYSIVSVEQSAKKYNSGALCCIERSLIDLEASIVTFNTNLKDLEEKMKRKSEKTKSIIDTYLKAYIRICGSWEHCLMGSVLNVPMTIN